MSTMNGSTHATHARNLLEHAAEMVENADRLQASEKIWGSVAHALKEIAEKRGWQDESINDLARIAGYLAVITGNDDIREKYRSARAFHTNFYEDEYEMEDIESGLASAEALIGLLKDADARLDGGVALPHGAASPEEYYARQQVTDLNRYTFTLRKQGLTSHEASAAARVVHESKRGGMGEVSFTVGAGKRRVTLGKDGMPQVSRPRGRSGGSRPVAPDASR